MKKAEGMDALIKRAIYTQEEFGGRVVLIRNRPGPGEGGDKQDEGPPELRLPLLGGPEVFGGGGNPLLSAQPARGPIRAANQHPESDPKLQADCGGPAPTFFLRPGAHDECPSDDGLQGARREDPQLHAVLAGAAGPEPPAIARDRSIVVSPTPQFAT